MIAPQTVVFTCEDVRQRSAPYKAAEAVARLGKGKAVRTSDLANALGVTRNRAWAVLAEAESLGLVTRPRDTGEWQPAMVFRTVG